MTEEIRILHVDDDPDLADVAAVHLERQDDRFAVETATSADAGLEILATRDVDCIVSDYDMPGRNGIELLEAVRDRAADLPFILYTGKGSEEVASEAISAGVTDYLQKGTGTSQYAVLANRVANAVERDRSKREAKAASERLARFVEQSPLGVIEWTEDFEFAALNSRAEEILGYDEANLLGRSWETIVPESAHGTIDEVVGALLANAGGYHSVNENVRGDGERIVCEWHNHNVTNDDGETVAVFSQFQDITERRAYERELEQYEAYLEGSTDIITVLDESGVVKYQSPSAARILGYEADALVGENGFDYIHPDDEQETFDTFLDLVESPGTTVTTEARFRTADGGWRWLEIRGRNYLDHPDIEGIITNNRDITARKERDDALQETNAVLSTLFETLPLGVIAENSSRDVLAANRRFCTLFDLPTGPDELAGEDCTELASSASDAFVDPAGFLDRIDALVRDGTPVDAERLDLADGRTFERSYRPLALPDGDGHLWVYREVTEQREHERTIERQNERLAEFASVVSHELRNPLTVAEGRLELARETSDDDHLDRVGRALDRLDTMIEDLLTLAREGEAVKEPEPVDFPALARNCWQNVKTDEATLETSLSRSLLADPGRLQQLLENLYRNAVEHGGPTGQITVGELEDGFYVADDGPGIPADQRERVFEAGYSRTESGTGFGLRIVAQIADAHGWTVTVTDADGGGARFEVTGVTFVG